MELSDGEIGEIWLRSGSVTDGYWGKPDHTNSIFRSKIENFTGEDNNSFLRTGDLAFVKKMAVSLYVGDVRTSS